MVILGIETSCDETAAAVVVDGKRILSNVFASQAKEHERFGGVVPELASRAHAEQMLLIIDEALVKAGVTLDEIDQIAVANGPGLIGSLMVGVNAAKTLAWSRNLPLVSVNHLHAHLYASLMQEEQEVTFPAIGVILSGGHTAILKMHSLTDYELLSTTVDDAIGEAFDKAAKVIGLPYPGGPEIEKLAKEGGGARFGLRPGRVKRSPHYFSFSGLKTGFLYAAKGAGAKKESPLLLKQNELADLAYEFQEVAFGDVVKKTLKIAREVGCSTLLFGGGVTMNQRLRELFHEQATGMQLLFPGKGLSLDNAAMIAGLGYHLGKNERAFDLHLEPSPSVSLLGGVD